MNNHNQYSSHRPTLMAFVHRALFTWFMLLVLLILIVLRLDKRIQWNWFIVFIPLWFYECILLMCVFFYLMSQWKYMAVDRFSKVRRHIFWLTIIVLLMSSQMTLCLKLENAAMNISMFSVMAPVWIILPLVLVDVFFTLIKSRRSNHCWLKE